MAKRKIPSTYVIIAAMILLCAVLTWFVPGGQYIKGADGSLTYEEVPSVPQTWQVFTSFFNGFTKQSQIIVFILVVGGAFWLLNSTGAVSAAISRFIGRIGNHGPVVLVSLSVLFSLAGAVFGMSEETIPFVGIVVPLVVSMGYDPIMGMLIVYVASNIGFSSAFLNPFTVGIAQQMSDLPLFSGMGYRILCWGVMTALTVAFILVYGAKTKGRYAPAKVDASPGAEVKAGPLPWRHKAILSVLALTIVALIAGVTLWKWYLGEITGLFLLMGILCGVIAGYGADKIVDEFLEGARDILSAALVVGFASGIIVVLQDGKIVDSILHAMQEGLDGTSPVASLGAMYGIQALINFIIPSATAKAAITIPIMAPFCDMVDVSRQAMVLAFQFGDGFTNMITPTSGVLMAALAMAKIPYGQWVAKAWKWVALLVLVGFLLLLPTVLLPVEGFR